LGLQSRRNRADGDAFKNSLSCILVVVGLREKSLRLLDLVLAGMDSRYQRRKLLLRRRTPADLVDFGAAPVLAIANRLKTLLAQFEVGFRGLLDRGKRAFAGLRYRRARAGMNSDELGENARHLFALAFSDRFSGALVHGFFGQVLALKGHWSALRILLFHGNGSWHGCRRGRGGRRKRIGREKIQLPLGVRRWQIQKRHQNVKHELSRKHTPELSAKRAEG
jgi:hypothetical protein